MSMYREVIHKGVEQDPEFTPVSVKQSSAAAATTEELDMQKKEVSIEERRPEEEKNIVKWAKKQFKKTGDWLGIADPTLQGIFPKEVYKKVCTIARTCGRLPVRVFERRSCSSRKPSRRDQQQYTSDISRSSDRRRGERKDPRRFASHELEEAMEHFKPSELLGEGGFGKVYKGKLPDTGQIVAIKVLSPDSWQGSKEFAAEVMTLSHADHPNLVKLVGYCAEGNKRLLVYEFMPLGSLDQHLHDHRRSGRPVLDWHTRMKIAAGAAKGLAYLHETMNPHVIYHDTSSANVLLGEGYHSKLSDFGFARVAPVGDWDCVSSRLMGTFGYCAPEYRETGKVTLELDIYCFGVLLLEILTGKKASDHTMPIHEGVLVYWVRHFRRDKLDYELMADPKLEGQYPRQGFYLALFIAHLCINNNPKKRPPLPSIILAYIV